MSNDQLTLGKAFRFSFKLWLITVLVGSLILAIYGAEKDNFVTTVALTALTYPYALLFSSIMSALSLPVFAGILLAIGKSNAKNKRKVQLTFIVNLLIFMLYFGIFYFVKIEQSWDIQWYLTAYAPVGLLSCLFKAMKLFPPEHAQASD